MKKKLFLLDAYALIYRGYFALSHSTRPNSKGHDTSAVMGFLLTFNDLRKQAEGHYIAVVFDPKGGSFRHEEYPEYKANRQQTPEAIRWGLPFIREIIAAQGVQMYEVSGYEADDVIGTIAHRVGATGDVEVLMVTPDKDYGQLVTDHIAIYRPLKGGGYELLRPQEVVERHGLQRAEQVIDFLALTGDTSDNVPGCKGIGDKGASKLLSTYNDIDDIYAHIDEIKGATGTKLSEHRDMVYLSRHLVTIVREVPLEFNLEECIPREIDLPALTRLYQELEFRTLLSRLSSTPVEAAPAPKQFSLFDTPITESESPSRPSALSRLADWSPTYPIVEGVKAVQQLAERLEGERLIAFDTETEGLDAMVDSIVGLSLSVKKGEAWYIPLPPNAEEATALLAPLRPLFAHPEVMKVGHNLKFDLHVIGRYGLHAVPPYRDTMIAHYLLNPELSHKMDSLAESYLHYTPIPITDLIGPKGKGQLSMRDLPIEQVAPYAAEDADITLQLYHRLLPELEQQGLLSLYDELEMPLMEVLLAMEQEGVRLDTQLLEEVSTDLETRLIALAEEIYKGAGSEFNINSPREVGKVLFEELALVDNPKKTKSGDYATGEEILQKLKKSHPIVEQILQYRGLRKLLSTYVYALPRLISPATQRIHTTYNQTVAATGRLSSTNPNLQNIPIRDEDGRELRKAFTALHEGELFLSADYSQIELRLMAHLSGDPALIEAFREGQDVHAATAAKIYKVPIDEVSSEMRRRAKTANFGIIYGISTFGLSERLDIPRKEAADLIEGYFESYPKVKEYMYNAIQQAREQGWVATLFGRRRYLPEISSGNATVRGFAERNAVNAPIQGSAADLIKLAMVRIYHRLQHEGLSAKMLLQVHDELNFSVTEAELPRLSALVREEMEGVYPQLSVPLTVEIGVGKSWFEAH